MGAIPDEGAGVGIVDHGDLEELAVLMYQPHPRAWKCGLVRWTCVPARADTVLRFLELQVRTRIAPRGDRSVSLSIVKFQISIAEKRRTKQIRVTIVSMFVCVSWSDRSTPSSRLEGARIIL